MPGQPKRARLLAALYRRAGAELGEGATPLDYICDAIAGGSNFFKLAASLEEEMGEPISRGFVSNVANNFSSDARARLDAARAEGAGALVDKALNIAEEAPTDAGGVQRAKLEIGMLQWTAERHNRAQYGSAKPELTINLGMLHLDALRQPLGAALPPEDAVRFIAGNAATEAEVVEE
jgi:hypothetical protein